MKKMMTTLTVVVFGFMASGAHADRLKQEQDRILLYFGSGGGAPKTVKTKYWYELDYFQKEKEKAEKKRAAVATTFAKQDLDQQLQNLNTKINRWRSYPHEVSPSKIVTVYDTVFRTGVQSPLMREYMRVRNNATHLDNQLKQRRWTKLQRADMIGKRNRYIERIKWFQANYPNIRNLFKAAYEKMIGHNINTYYRL